MTWTRSLLKYPGGKYALLEAIDNLMPKESIDMYAEPFLGGGSVALNIGRRYPRMLLNDANPDIITFWEQIAKNPDLVLSEIHKLVGRLSTFESKDVYLAVRDAFNLRDSSEHIHAALFYFLNKQGFNGLIRYNQSGQFNVPPGRYKTFPSINFEHIHEISEILSGPLSFHAMDWQRFVDKVVIPETQKVKNAFVYLDPPYIPINETSNFTCYWKPFGVKEHTKLKRSLDKLTELGVKWMLSNSKCKETESIFEGYRFTEVQAPRSISCKGKGRGSITEYIITNFKA